VPRRAILEEKATPFTSLVRRFRLRGHRICAHLTSAYSAEMSHPALSLKMLPEQLWHLDHGNVRSLLKLRQWSGAMSNQPCPSGLRNVFTPMCICIGLLRIYSANQIFAIQKNKSGPRISRNGFTVARFCCEKRRV
jgi:hypothetical protein